MFLWENKIKPCSWQKSMGTSSEGRQGREPESLSKSDRLFRSGMRLHPRDGMDSIVLSHF